MLPVKVHAANEHDSKAGFEVIEQLKWQFERMKKIYADGGYRGEFVDKVKDKLGSKISADWLKTITELVSQHKI